VVTFFIVLLVLQPVLYGVFMGLAAYRAAKVVRNVGEKYPGLHDIFK
jgi:hypothetical protein